jgi:peptide/histidine transporter 3/4
MVIAIVFFFIGSQWYRLQVPGGSPLTRICQVIVATFKKHGLRVPDDKSLLYETSDAESNIKGSRKLEHTDELK